MHADIPDVERFDSRIDRYKYPPQDSRAQQSIGNDDHDFTVAAVDVVRLYGTV